MLPRLALDDVEVFKGSLGYEQVRARSFIPAGTEVGVLSNDNETRFIGALGRASHRANLTRISGPFGVVLCAKRDIKPGKLLFYTKEWPPKEELTVPPQPTFYSSFLELVERYEAIDEAKLASIHGRVRNSLLDHMTRVLSMVEPPEDDVDEADDDDNNLRTCVSCQGSFPPTTQYFAFFADKKAKMAPASAADARIAGMITVERTERDCAMKTQSKQG